MNTKEFLKEKKRLECELKSIDKQLCALKPTFPGERFLRPAEPDDIRVGHLIWMLDCDDVDVEPVWQVIEEVRDPNDDFKAFVAEDGCRYGLHDCWVEVEA